MSNPELLLSQLDKLFSRGWRFAVAVVRGLTTHHFLPMAIKPFGVTMDGV